MILEVEILEGIFNQIIIEVKIINVNMEEIIEMIIMKEVEVGPGINNTLIIKGMIEVTVGLDQVQEPVWKEIELDVINAGNMIILLKTVWLFKILKESEQTQQMYNMDDEQTALKLLATDTYNSLNRIYLIDRTPMDHLNL